MAAGGTLVGRGYVSIRPEFEGNWSRAAQGRGSAAGSSFSKGFSRAVSSGLKGIGALAGVAVASNLTNIAGAAALAAPALATVGAAAGALKLGLSGVGDAFKAAFADSSADAKAAASATRQVESAQRSLADAQRALADARVQAAERVAEAQQGVRDAERDLSDAQRDARNVQADLNDARIEAARALEDMNSRLKDSQLDEREAVLRLKEAEDELRKAQAKPGVTPQEIEKLTLARDRAKQNLTEQRTETKRLAADTAKANKAGVNGSDQVLTARQRISDANQTVADKERALAQAQAGVDKARADGQRSIADAQRNVAEAAQALADAQAAAAAQTSKLDQAMAKLSPNAKSFVNAIRGVAPAWTAMRLGVQDRLFAGLDTRVSALARQTIPTLQRGLTGTAGVLNTMAKSAIDAVSSLQKTGMLKQILDGATKNLAIFEKVPGQVVTAFGQMTVAAQPAFNQLLTQIGGGLDGLFTKLEQSFGSGGFAQAIDTAMTLFSQLLTAAGNAFGILSSVLKAASDAGGQIIGVVGAGLAELNRIAAMPQVQASLRAIFASVAQIVGAIVPVIGAVAQAVLPLIAMFAPFIQQITQQLAPVLLQMVSALGSALTPILAALLPALFQVSSAIVQVVSMVTPLLAPISQLLTAVIGALMPVLQPLVGLILQLVQSAIGPLMTIVGAVVPVVQLFGQILSGVMAALQPILGPAVELLGQVAGLLAGLFAQAVGQLLGVIQPLIPIGIQLVQSVLGALAPILPVVGQAITQVVAALGGLLPMVAGVWAQLAGSLAPILRQLTPILAQVASVIVSGLAVVLPVLTQVVSILFRALSPLFPLIGQIVGIVVQLAGNVLAALMPALSQLIKAAVQLLVAFLPILPPVAQLIGLVVGLAAGILSVLLPPLVKVASFLVGILAGALGTVIGWVAKLVSWIASILGPTVKWLAGVITWAVNGMLRMFRWFYDVLIGHSILPDIVRYIRQVFAVTFGWLYNNIIKPVWHGIQTAISVAWNKGIKPVFNALKAGVGLVATSFRIARDGIGKVWAKIQDLTKKPIAFVINTVYNRGVVPLWNAAAKVLPISKLQPFKPKGFARGGILPGYQRAKRDDVLMPMRSGEGVLVPEAVKGLGKGFIDAANAAGNRGGVEGVRRAFGPGLAEGGIVGDHGGIGDWFGGTLKNIGGLVGKAKDWVLGNVAKVAELAAKPIRALIDRIPGGKTGFGQLATALPRTVLDRALSFIRGSERDTLQSAGGQWIKPVNVPYGTRFGVRGRMWSSGRHTGLDFPAPIGTPVHAVAAGQIASALSGGPYGNHILINHGGGLQSLYAHLSKMLVKSGAVAQGRVIGRVGATGNVTGPHLHLEARLSGRPVDPMPYLTGGGSAGSGGKGVQRWRSTVLSALSQVGQPASLANTVLRRMNQESGGDPNIVNRWDSNWKAGHPSVGLMQVIRGTFQAFAGKYRNTGPFSYGVSTNPLANIYASMRYALSRYGSLSSAYNRPGGYDSGGWLQPGWTPVYNGLGEPEAVVTPRQLRALEGAATAGVVSSGGEFTGDLYLDSGEFLGKVRGVVRQENGAVLQALGAMPRRG
jgi:phage-related protein